MAKAKTPLLSFGARGKIGDALEFSRVKRQNRIRSRAIPSNPQTAVQQSNRSRMSKAVTAWRQYFLHADFKPSWNLYAKQLKSTMSGYNKFAGCIVAMDQVNPNAPFGDQCQFRVGGDIHMYLINPSTGASGPSAGLCQIYQGLSPSSLLYWGQRTSVANKLQFNSSEPAGTLIYVQAFYQSIPMSGIYAGTVQA